MPGFRFHALVGRDRGRYAVNASGNWRITFGWMEGDANIVTGYALMTLSHCKPKK